MKVLSQQNESLDEICFRYYGTCIGTVERVLEVHPGLCDQADRLPMGVEILLPEINAATSNRSQIVLWD
uniref:Phage tail protein X n=1 Tax=Arsenophonus endosymbiont of Trialeurodes vaporariorum TaxID=235567 RepID=A0A3B0MJZ4_9GAMM